MCTVHCNVLYSTAIYRVLVALPKMSAEKVFDISDFRLDFMLSLSFVINYPMMNSWIKREWGWGCSKVVATFNCVGRSLIVLWSLLQSQVRTNGDDCHDTHVLLDMIWHEFVFTTDNISRQFCQTGETFQKSNLQQLFVVKFQLVPTCMFFFHK